MSTRLLSWILVVAGALAVVGGVVAAAYDAPLASASVVCTCGGALVLGGWALWLLERG